MNATERADLRAALLRWGWGTDGRGCGIEPTALAAMRAAEVALGETR